ncbi:MAG: mechanosensitive ion channel family protein, partial [Acidobacteriota bacterium]
MQRFFSPCSAASVAWRRSPAFFVNVVLVAALFGLLGPGLVTAQEPTAPTGGLAASVDPSTDASIEDGIRQRLSRLEGADTIEVDVEAGIVTLSGSVLRASVGESAVSIAMRTEGVADVVDEIELITSPAARLEPAVDTAVERLQLLLSYLPLLAVSLVVMLIFWLLSGVVSRLDFFFKRLRINRFAKDLLRQAIRVAIILAGVLIALEILDATALVGAVLGAAGVVGLAVGFAFKDLVENYIASILLSIRQPFAPDDHVRIDSHEGKVVRLTSRATILMTLDGNHLRVPNAQVYKAVILNYSRNPLRRFSFGVGVGVNEDLQAAQRLGLEALDRMPGVLEDPGPLSLIDELGDSNVLIKFFGWVDQREASFGKVKGGAIRRVKTALEEAGMDLPEPIYRVHLMESAGPQPEPPAPVPPEPEAADEDIAIEHHLEDQMAKDRCEAETE